MWMSYECHQCLCSTNSLKCMNKLSVADLTKEKYLHTLFICNFITELKPGKSYLWSIRDYSHNFWILVFIVFIFEQLYNKQHCVIVTWINIQIKSKAFYFANNHPTNTKKSISARYIVNSFSLVHKYHDNCIFVCL